MNGSLLPDRAGHPYGPDVAAAAKSEVDVAAELDNMLLDLAAGRKAKTLEGLMFHWQKMDAHLVTLKSIVDAQVVAVAALSDDVARLVAQREQEAAVAPRWW